MATDFLTLLRRDHHDLEVGLDELLAPWSTMAQLRSTLDGVRLGLTAHAEAEDIVLYSVIANTNVGEQIEALVAEARDAHMAQETALSALVCALPNTQTWRDRATHLRSLVRDHARYEELHLIPAIRELARDTYDHLAGKFATKRLRQLAMLQPSAPLFIAELQAS